MTADWESTHLCLLHPNDYWYLDSISSYAAFKIFLFISFIYRWLGVRITEHRKNCNSLSDSISWFEYLNFQELNCVTKSLNCSHYLCLCIGIICWSSVYNALLTKQVYLWALCSPSGIEPMSLLHWVRVRGASGSQWPKQIKWKKKKLNKRYKMKKKLNIKHKMFSQQGVSGASGSQWLASDGRRSTPVQVHPHFKKTPQPTTTFWKTPQPTST